MKSMFQTYSWETDSHGWRTLSLPNGWLFVIDPKLTPHYHGIEVFLCRENAVLTQGFTKVQSVVAAMRVCEKLIETNTWHKYKRRKHVQQTYRVAA